MEKFGYKNKMAVPKIEKVVINTSFGRLIAGKSNEEQRKFCQNVLEDVTVIAGQKPVATRAKKSISSFKIREGQIIGVAVTLRKKMMFDFLERFINIVLPRTRDFQGINPDAFDRSGNLSVGIKEHIAFPEVVPEKAKSIFGLQVTIATDAKTKEEGLELLRLIGFPIKTT